MGKDLNDRATAAAVLRRKALQSISFQKLQGKDIFPSTDETLKELQVHQIELEMQNEELLQTRSALQVTQKRYFELYDQAPVGYCTVSEDNVIEEANLKAADLLGVPEAELVGLRITTFIQQVDQDVYYLARKALFETGVAFTVELRMKREGLFFWAKLSVTLTKGADKVPACRVVIQDISRRKNVEDTLALKNKLIDVTLGSIPVGIVTTDASGRLVLMNSLAQEMTGWSESEALGQSIATVLPVLDELSRRPLESLVLRVLASGTTDPETRSVLLVSRAGAHRYISCTTSLIQGAGGTVNGAVFVFRDVTEHRRLEGLAQQAEKLDSLGVLAGGITHDFNNLLGGIFGYLTLAKSAVVKSSAADNPLVLDYLNKAGLVFHRAKALTKQLAIFSKGGGTILSTGRLVPIIKGAATFVLTGSNIDCDFLFSDNLDLCDFDGPQMNQVFTNLILNAKQAMPLGGRIQVSAQNIALKRGGVPFLPLGNYLRISVTDHGEGIPPKLFKKIFDPFFTTRKDNQGLGLTSTQSIIHKHGGEIEVLSETGKGTTFHVHLPASTKGADIKAGVPVVLGPNPGTILVMDDEPFMREIIGETLKSIGYSVVEADSGEAAVKLCTQGQTLQAAIFDLNVMGEMKGEDTLAAIRSVLPNLPVFVSSGFSEDPVMVKPQDFGFTDSLGKPFQQEDLARLLLKYL